MSDTVKANVYARCPLGGLPRFLLVMLADEADDDGLVTMNHARVVSKMGIDERTLSRLVTRCVAEAGLEYAPGCGRGSKSAFVLASYVDRGAVKVDKDGEDAPLSDPTKVDKDGTESALSTLSTFPATPLSPPMVPPSLPPTPPNLPPPLSPPTPRFRQRPAQAPSGAPDGAFSSIVLARIEASIGGASLSVPGGKLKPGIGQTIGLLGGWTDDDAEAACALWERFAASKEWQFKGHTSNWPIAVGDWRAKTGGSRPGSASRTTPSEPGEAPTPEVVAARRAKLASIMGGRS